MLIIDQVRNGKKDRLGDGKKGKKENNGRIWCENISLFSHFLLSFPIFVIFSLSFDFTLLHSFFLFLFFSFIPLPSLSLFPFFSLFYPSLPISLSLILSFFSSSLFQGTILDRIDYNLEQAAYHIEQGRENLVKVGREEWEREREEEKGKGGTILRGGNGGEGKRGGETKRVL